MKRSILLALAPITALTLAAQAPSFDQNYSGGQNGRGDGYLAKLSDHAGTGALHNDDTRIL